MNFKPMAQKLALRIINSFAVPGGKGLDSAAKKIERMLESVRLAERDRCSFIIDDHACESCKCSLNAKPLTPCAACAATTNGSSAPRTRAIARAASRRLGTSHGKGKA
jgi:hypothetical protein